MTSGAEVVGAAVILEVSGVEVDVPPDVGLGEEAAMIVVGSHMEVLGRSVSVVVGAEVVGTTVELEGACVVPPTMLTQT